MNTKGSLRALLIPCLFWILICPISCRAAEKKILANDAAIAYSGRVGHEGTATVIYWSGTNVRFSMDGNGVQAEIDDQKGDNYFNIIVDGKVHSKFNPDAGKKVYTLVSGLPKGRHTIELFKLTEERHGRTKLFGLTIMNGALLEKPAEHKRKIEFYGNSITSGYSLEDSAGDSNKPEYFNNYKSYAAITARHFDADYYCISKSGIGVTVSWFPIIMPEMYDRLDPSDPKSKWDFEKYTPEVVVVNLLSNDIDLVNMPKDENFIARFGDKKPSNDFICNAYKVFLMSIRQKYPSAWIVCTLDAWKDPESDGHRFPGIIRRAVDELNDARVKAHFFDYPRQHKKGHPKVKDHESMAASLIAFLEMNVQW